MTGLKETFVKRGFRKWKIKPKQPLSANREFNRDENGILKTERWVP